MIYINNIYFEKEIDGLKAIGKNKEELREELLNDKKEGLDIWTFYQEKHWDSPKVSKHMNRHGSKQNIKSSLFYVDHLIKALEMEWS